MVENGYKHAGFTVTFTVDNHKCATPTPYHYTKLGYGSGTKIKCDRCGRIYVLDTGFDQRDGDWATWRLEYGDEGR